MGFFKRLAILLATGVVLLSLPPQQAVAQNAGDNASLILTALEEGADDARLQELVNAALAKYPQGGAELVALIRRLVIASPKLADAFLNARSSASSGQKSSIGTGLGQAVSIINKKDPEAATAIAQLVAAANDKVIQTAFVAAVGDGTAATGAGGGGTAATGAGGGGTARTAGGGGRTAGGRASGPRAGSLAVQSSGGGSGGGDPVSPSS